MNKFFKLSTLLFCCLLGNLSLMAQTKTLNNVLAVELRNTGSIIQQNEIKGYYLFYKTDKLDKKNNIYQIQILDQNLNEAGSEEIIGPKYLTLLEASYNGNYLLFKFFDSQKKEVILQLHDNNAKLVSKTSKKVSKYEASMYMAANSEIQNISTFAAGDKGFVSYSIVNGKSYGHSIDYTSPDKEWNYTSDLTSRDVELATFMAASQDVIISTVSKRKSLLSTDVSLNILGLDAKTGKKLFEKPLSDSKYELSLMNAYVNETGQVALFGQYYQKGANIAKDKSLGLFSYLMDTQGDMIIQNNISWSNDVSKFLPVNSRGKIENVGYLFFHKIVKAADGKVFAIGEQYRKTASAGGIATRALGVRGMSTSKIVMEDIVIFEFGSNFKLTGVKIYDKGKTNVDLPEGAGWYGPQMLANYVKATGGFDYLFTQMNKDESSFSIGYRDYEKKKGEKDEWVFHAVTYIDNQFSTDKISLQTEASARYIYPAKPGYIMLSEYFRKTKKIELRLEKFNY